MAFTGYLKDKESIENKLSSIAKKRNISEKYIEKPLIKEEVVRLEYTVWKEIFYNIQIEI